ncbi:NAC domain-containing protein 104 [Sesamum indicum]|uniref:NAC domain-containing protein 104 n=1 Tax=Sesamum indicum TaxID=4182 RepID=A0A6I9UKV9_SESIN|nr:NAC domain-containing protein 104 [Sesamum indicum]
MGDQKLVLPPGFEFDPTDEELIVYFLCRRAASIPCYPNIIPDLDIYAADPWELNEKAFSSKREWYFFSRWRQNRSTRRGFWKEIGLNEPIFTSNGNEVGIKNYLVFYGDHDHEDGSKVQTNWAMEEYHLLKPNSQVQDDINDEWVLCRVHEENIVDSQDRDYFRRSSNVSDGVELSYLDEIYCSMDDEQDEITFPN